MVREAYRLHPVLALQKGPFVSVFLSTTGSTLGSTGRGKIGKNGSSLVATRVISWSFLCCFDCSCVHFRRDNPHRGDHRRVWPHRAREELGGFLSPGGPIYLRNEQSRRTFFRPEIERGVGDREYLQRCATWRRGCMLPRAQLGQDIIEVSPEGRGLLQKVRRFSQVDTNRQQLYGRGQDCSPGGHRLDLYGPGGDPGGGKTCCPARDT